MNYVRIFLSAYLTIMPALFSAHQKEFSAGHKNSDINFSEFMLREFFPEDQPHQNQISTESQRLRGICNLVKEYLIDMTKLISFVAVTRLRPSYTTCYEKLDNVRLSQDGRRCMGSSSTGHYIITYNFNKLFPAHLVKIPTTKETDQYLALLNPEKQHTLSIPRRRFYGAESYGTFYYDKLFNKSSKVDLPREYTACAAMNSDESCIALYTGGPQFVVSILSLKSQKVISRIQFHACNIPRIWLHASTFSVFVQRFSDSTTNQSINTPLFSEAALFQDSFENKKFSSKSLHTPVYPEAVGVSPSGLQAFAVYEQVTRVSSFSSNGHVMYDNYPSTTSLSIASADITNDGQFIVYGYSFSEINRLFMNAFEEVQKLSLDQLTTVVKLCNMSSNKNKLLDNHIRIFQSLQQPFQQAILSQRQHLARDLLRKIKK